jgi:hypothetical protein
MSLPIPPPGLFLPPFMLQGVPPIPPAFAVQSMNSLSKESEDRWFRPSDDVEPNETLYVNNINTRVKEKVLKEHLKSV